MFILIVLGDMTINRDFFLSNLGLGGWVKQMFFFADGMDKPINPCVVQL